MKKKITIIIIILLIGVGFIYGIYKFIDSKFASPIYTLYEKKDLTVEEIKFKEEFYNDAIISKGDIFDLKYRSFQDKEDCSIGIFKKTKSKVPDIKVYVYDASTNKEIGWTNLFSVTDVYMGGSYQENQELVWYFEGKMLWQFKFDNQKEDDENSDYKNLKIVITYKDGKETHYLHAPDNSNTNQND